MVPAMRLPLLLLVINKEKLGKLGLEDLKGNDLDQQVHPYLRRAGKSLNLDLLTRSHKLGQPRD